MLHAPSSSLDLFLLQLISTGINTPYLLRERARLSVGATIPALNRMEDQGLVNRQKKERRNKQQYSLTTKGKRHLSAQLTALLAEYVEQPPTDVESLLRAVALACAQLKPEQVNAMLDAAAKERGNRKASIQNVNSVDLKRVDDSYCYFLGRVASARLDAEASALRELAKFLSTFLVGARVPKKIVFLK
jgi:DNA-binding PadR family transcriptional regulator